MRARLRNGSDPTGAATWNIHVEGWRKEHCIASRRACVTKAVSFCGRTWVAPNKNVANDIQIPFATFYLLGNARAGRMQPLFRKDLLHGHGTHRGDLAELVQPDLRTIAHDRNDFGTAGDDFLVEGQQIGQ